ncbi:TPA: hypothetical protein JBF55_11400 [Legionella pneumophila]|nr:hypothetical protein [Legionella pneumophila]HAU4213653.1 hypothetical protein [Legionella pneumophila]
MIATTTKIRDFSSSSSYPLPFVKSNVSQIHYQFSDNLFLNLKRDSTKNLYVMIKDESDHHIGFEQQLKRNLKNKGCTIVKNPNRAQYTLNVQLKKIGVMPYEELQKALLNGYGSPLDVNNYKLLDDLTDKNSFSFLISDIQINEWIGIVNGEKIDLIRQRSKFKTFQTRLVISTEKFDLTKANGLLKREFSCIVARIFEYVPII